METEHSPAEWQELIKQLRKVVADQGRSREDRRKAQSILERIGAHAPRARPTTKQWGDQSFYTDLI